MQAVGIGDLHMTDSSGMGGLAKYIPNHDQFVVDEVESVLGWAKKKGISNVFLYGDVCESPRLSYEAQRQLIRLFKRHPRMTFYAILGNHDKFGYLSSLGHSLELLLEYELKNVRIFSKTEVVKIDDVEVNFMPWPDQKFNPRLLNVAHKEVQGSKLDSGRLIEDEELSKSKAVVAIGHLHTAHRIRNCYFSGTLYQTNFGESLNKFFHFIDFRSPDDYEIELIPHKPKYRLHTCVINSRADLKTLPTDPTDLIKLVIADGADIDQQEIVRPNIVVTKAFKTKNELTSILTEDLINGRELVIRTNDFFKQWLKPLDMAIEEKRAMLNLRKRVLQGTY